MKSRWPAVCLWLLSGLAWGQSAPQGGAAVALVAAASSPEQQRSERERLAQARAAQQARWAEREQGCSRLFWVNDCLRQAKLEYRQAMSEIERQQTRLEHGIRQQRASELAQRINSRTQERTPERTPERSEPPQEREQRHVGAAERSAAAERAQIVPAQPMPAQQTVQQQDQQQDQQQEQRKDRRQIQAGERLLKQEQRQEQASARAQRREQSAQAGQAAQAARLERYARRAAASDEAPP
jgi:hypothetical protein